MDGRRWGGADLHSSGPPGGRSFLTVLCPPRLCLSRVEYRILGFVPWHPVIQSLRSWNFIPGAPSPLHLEPPPELLLSPCWTCTPALTTHGLWSVVHSPPGVLPLLVTLGTGALHCPSWDPARVPCKHLSLQEESGVDFLKLLLLQDWDFLSWRLLPQPLARLLTGAPPLFDSFFFFPTCLPCQKCKLLSVTFKLFSL